MKKLLVFLLCMSMVLSFAACGEDTGTCGCGANGAKKTAKMEGRTVYFCEDCANYLMDQMGVSSWSRVQQFAIEYMNE